MAGDTVDSLSLNLYLRLNLLGFTLGIPNGKPLLQRFTQPVNRRFS